MMRPLDATGIVEERQADRAKWQLVKAPVNAPFSHIAELARIAVDAAIKDAVNREVERRRDEINGISRPSGPSIEMMLDAVLAATGLPESALRGPARDRPIAWGRALFWYIASALRRDLSYPMLAKTLGFKDHTSPLHAIRRFPQTRLLEPLATYCLHPAITELLAAADENPRQARARKQ
jgi:hypothetical protein